MYSKSDIINQYSTAFIEVIQQEMSASQSEYILKEIIALYDAIDENKKYLLMLDSPVIDNEDKKQLIKELFFHHDKEITFLQNMFLYIIDKSDQKLILNILDEIITKLTEDLGYIRLKITSAFTLNQESIDKIVQKVSTKLKKKVISKVEIDPSYIAGISIEYNSKTINNSIKTKMMEIRRKLLS